MSSSVDSGIAMTLGMGAGAHKQLKLNFVKLILYVYILTLLSGTKEGGWYSNA